MKNDRPYIVNLREQLEPWHKPHQLVVLRIIIPAQDWQTVLGLELVAIRRVINDDNVFHATTDALHILYKLPIEEGAMLSEQPLRGDTLRVEHVHQRDGIFAKTGGENYDFVVLAHFNDELTALWPHLNVDIAGSTFYVDWKNDVRLISWSKSRMH